MSDSGNGIQALCPMLAKRDQTKPKESRRNRENDDESRNWIAGSRAAARLAAEERVMDAPALRVRLIRRTGLRRTHSHKTDATRELHRVDTESGFVVPTLPSPSRYLNASVSCA
jgi:hypothetical protein